MSTQGDVAGRIFAVMHNLCCNRIGRMNQETSRPNSLVIVVDDDDAVRNSLKFSLEIEGFAVRLYSGSAELLAAPDVDECACLIIDQNMPGLTGLETVKKLRERRVTVPTILITGHPSAALRARARGAGADVVEKPLFGNALIEGIRGIIRH
jgi:two-component system response regulator FixJ